MTFLRGRSSFLQRSKEPSGSTIAGILQTLVDDFAEDLQKELSDEKTNQRFGEMTCWFDRGGFGLLPTWSLHDP